MSNISKIKLSGTTYTLKDNNATKTSEVTQAQYDALVSAGTVDTNTFYVITDATPVDISNYYTSAQTESAITAAVSGKVDTSAITSSVTSASTDSEIPTAKAVYNAIPTGGTGGGKAISAGTNISVTTGETADTVSCTLPISVGNSNTLISIGNGSNKNIAFGQGNTFGGTNANCLVGGRYCKIGWNVSQAVALGYESSANTSYSTAIGTYVKTLNNNEVTFGFYNHSNTGSTEADKTLFSIGNGSSNATHNAFEIRQNGDIYITSGGTDIKLQDNLGGGSASSAITSGDTNAVAGGAVYDRFDEVEQVTARALNELSEADEVAARALVDLDSRFGGLKLVKITQSAYDALTTKDSNTLYVITS